MNPRLRAVVVASCLLSFLVCAAAPLHAAKYKIRWLIGHADLDYFEDAAIGFKAALEEGSNGEIEVEIVTSKNPWEDASGRATPEIADKVAKGEAEMGHSFTNIMGNLDHRLWAFDLPYLFEGYRHLEGVFEGPIGPELLEGLRAHRLIGLAFTYSGGAHGVATLDREIRGPEDLKGLKVGVFGNAVDTAWLSLLGATPVPIGHQIVNIVPGTQDGSLDAAVITWRRAHDMRLQERFKHVNLMSSSYLTSLTYVNEEFFEGLPEAYRALIRKSAREAGRIERARTIELNETCRREMAAKGLEPVYLSAAGRLKFQEALRPAYTGPLADIVGKDLIERIRSTGAGPQPQSGLELVRGWKPRP